MVELEWIYAGPNRWYCNWGKYFLKKKIVSDSERYEIWKGEVLLENKLDYFSFLSMISKHYKNEELEPRFIR